MNNENKELRCTECNTENVITNLNEWINDKKITYECKNRKECKKRQLEYFIKNPPKKRETEEEKNANELKEKYGIDMSELKKIPSTIRDGCTYYIHEPSKDIYFKSIYGLPWEKKSK
jgi:hypothetical protein